MHIQFEMCNCTYSANSICGRKSEYGQVSYTVLDASCYKYRRAGGQRSTGPAFLDPCRLQPNIVSCRAAPCLFSFSFKRRLEYRLELKFPPWDG